MFSRSHFIASTLSAALTILSCLPYHVRAVPSDTHLSGFAQIDERERGIKLYEQGDTAAAVQSLKTFVKSAKNDIRAWHYLGLALSSSGKTSDARKAHEKAAKIGTELIMRHFVGTTSTEEISARIQLIKADLEVAADSAAKYLELSSNPSRSKMSEWRERAERLHGVIELAGELGKNNNYKPSEVTTKARILSKPSPEYTEEARVKQVTGTVVLVLILSVDGTVKGFIPIVTLPYGLTEKCIEVARLIKFTPATLNGKPVSQLTRVEYNFNIY
jgi:hypothetical protein